MRTKFIIIWLIVFGIEVNAQHIINADFAINTSTHFQLEESTEMFKGFIKTNQVQLESIAAYADGDIIFNMNEIIDLPSSNVDFVIAFKNVSNNQDIFSIRISDAIRIEENYNGIQNNIVLDLPVYSDGTPFRNQLKISRCNNQILYFINGTIANQLELIDNAFDMVAEIDLINTSDYEFDAEITLVQN